MLKYAQNFTTRCTCRVKGNGVLSIVYELAFVGAVASSTNSSEVRGSHQYESSSISSGALMRHIAYNDLVLLDVS